MSSIRCFFCEEIPEKGKALLSKQEERHLFSSLRKSSGDQILLLDGNGVVARAEIHGKDVVVLSKEIREMPAPRMHLFFCPPHNKNRADTILAQATELGVASITPITARNSVSRPEAAPDRWRVHLIEAIKQSFNPFLPKISPVMSIEEAVLHVKQRGFFSCFGSLKSGSRKSLQSANFADLAWFVGPEGGFTELEETMMIENGFQPIRIGNCVLRIETASCAGLALLLGSGHCFSANSASM